MTGSPIPVTILSGFLGAGKTTFLNSLIQSLRAAGRRPLIIENEYGQENIDSELVFGAESGLFEFSNGCLCCDLNEDLFDLLLELWKKRAEFDELIIETTGIADPANVALPFLTNPAIGAAYRLTRIVGLADARLIEFQLADTEEARKQISFSDILLITKTEDLSGHEKEKIMRLLAGLNPFAMVLSGNKTDGYPMEKILDFLRYKHPEQDRPGAYPANPGASSHEHHKHDHPHGAGGHCHDAGHHDHGAHADAHQHPHHHEHHHHHDIASLSFRFPDSFDMEELEFRLMVFLQGQAKNIYRVKGIVHAQGQDHKIIVQSVAHYLSVGEGKPWGAEEDRISRIVFIGKNLNPQGFEKMLRQCLFSGGHKSKSEILR
ncbi:MAG TPA: GTP-binding protein [Puia sp.]|uniref:CobW family GTP-binding protein n=1 Tax=Puia sp. TaxID=2045100 RepID=UPI002CAB9647|nr:GTP-binding protein [Puia sp.]HVU98713.1 GTP-binding protein [Puia sp.]